MMWILARSVPLKGGSHYARTTRIRHTEVSIQYLSYYICDFLHLCIMKVSVYGFLDAGDGILEWFVVRCSSSEGSREVLGLVAFYRKAFSVSASC